MVDNSSNGTTKDTIVMEFMAGAVSGISGVGVSYPFDTIKTLMQNSREYYLRDVIQEIGKVHDWRTYFRGVSMPLSSYVFINALAFSTFKPVQNWLDGEDGQEKGPLVSPAVSALFAGAAAGTTQLVITIPAELVKVNMQVTAIDSNQPNLSAVASVRKIISTARIEGRSALSSLYRGSMATASRDIPGWGVYFACYYTVRDGFHDWLGLGFTGSTFLAGGVAGIASWVVTLPMDTMKTRIQSGKNDTMLSVVRSFREHQLESRGASSRGGWLLGGLSMYYKGLGVVCLRAAIVNSVSLCVYDAVIAQLSGQTR